MRAHGAEVITALHEHDRKTWIRGQKGDRFFHFFDKIGAVTASAEILQAQQMVRTQPQKAIVRVQGILLIKDACFLQSRVIS